MAKKTVWLPKQSNPPDMGEVGYRGDHVKTYDPKAGRPATDAEGKVISTGKKSASKKADEADEGEE